ncbi:phosphomannomutase/phosphoglucomutase [Magnetovibrio sp. PR-2]|uniref:phosphoglucomutase/phosphomannomutase PgmG n=1 Tax=Magnetovibrio sp. PR-2 TaxID=3120356 RepID=UPI002FCE066E
MPHSDARTLDAEILREYDIRGITTDNFKAEDVFVIGRAFGAILQGRGGKSAAVGYDGRLTSPELEAALVEGLTKSGINVKRVGRGPTPMLYYAGATQNVDAALMITGSHNPPEYNGIKMTIGGKSFFGEDIQKLGEVAASGAFVDGEGQAEEIDIFEDYVQRMMQDFHGTKDMTVAWDPGNGAAGEVVAELIKRLPGTHHIINEVIDGTFPAHHPDPTVEKNLDQLKALVAQNNCDIGFGFDGDGDRIGMIDSQGRVLWGDQIMVLAAREVLADEPGATIIADVKASQVFVDEIERMGGKPMIYKTGHSHIKAKMHETGAPLAGEMSAHIFFKHKYYGYDDAVYTAIRILSVVASADETLDQMFDSLPKMLNTPEIRIDCSEDRKFVIIEEVRERLKGQQGISVNEIDGVRVTTDDGWWLLRASNTQAVLVARCESETADGLARLKAQLVEQMEASDVTPPDLG